MLQVCRICLLFITTDDTFLKIEDDSESLSPATIRYKITSIFPDINLNVSNPSVICKSCYNTLEISFNFKSKCLTTEGIIIKYKQAKNIQQDGIDLKHVALLNNGSVFGTKISLDNVDLVEVSNQIKVEDVKQESIVISDDEPDNCQLVSENVDEIKIENYEDYYRNLSDSTNYYPKIVELPGCSQNSQSTQQHTQFYDLSSNQYMISQNEYLDKNQCSMCLRTFKSQSRVRKHMSYHCKNRFNYVESNGDNEIRLCDDSNDDDFEVNVTTSGYLVHKKPKASVKKRFPCKLCSKKFRTSTGLSFHVNRYCKKKAKTNKRIYLKTHKCVDCKKKLFSMVTNDNPYKCHICVHKIFDNYNAYKWHMKYVHDANPYHCKLCTKTFTSKKDLCNHTCTGNKGGECVACKEKNAKFLTEYYGYRYKCKICDERVSTYDSYKWHMEFMHKLEGFCGICFVITKDFHGHICGFECAVCANVFKSRDDLENHPHMCMQG